VSDLTHGLSPWFKSGVKPLHFPYFAGFWGAGHGGWSTYRGNAPLSAKTVL
jgi:hypothetical protein